MELLAVDIHQMTSFKFGLYSIGFYLETDGVKFLCKSKYPSVAEALNLLISRHFEWSFRNGSMGHLRDALVRRLKAASEVENGAQTRLDSINSFSHMFPNTPLVPSEEGRVGFCSRVEPPSTERMTHREHASSCCTSTWIQHSLQSPNWWKSLKIASMSCYNDYIIKGI